MRADRGGPRKRATIKDPLLHRFKPGPDFEPDLEQLLKAGRRPQRRKVRGTGFRAYLRMLGPGLITGASDDDPSGIGTYSQVGSQFGYGLLWTALFTFPLMAAVEELCARIALHTGAGLGVALRRKFPTTLVGICILALFGANTINVGADLGAVAAGGSLPTRGPSPRSGWWWRAGFWWSWPRFSSATRRSSGPSSG